MNKKIIAITSAILTVLFLLIIALGISFYYFSSKGATQELVREKIKTSYYFKDEYFSLDDSYLYSTVSSIGNEGSVNGVLINSLEDNSIYMRDSNHTYGSPLYKNGELLGSIHKSNGKVCLNDKYGNDIILENNTYDHEVYLYNNNLFTFSTVDGLQSNIGVYDLLTENFTYYNFFDGVGLPANANDDGYNWMPSVDAELHSNSFDYYDDHLYVSSRSFSSIFSLTISDNGVLRPTSDWQFDWILPSDPTVLYFIQEDSNGNNPYKKDLLGNDVINSEYIPTLLDSWKGKIVSPLVNGRLYNLENKDDALEYEFIDHKLKFFGQHKVSVLNCLFESNETIINDYNSEHLYLSLHDNHWAGNETNNFYVPHGNYYDLLPELEEKSYTKILDVDLEQMTYEVILNYDNSTLTKNNMQTDIRSQSMFFAVDDRFYLNTSSDTARAVQLLEFDSIDVESKDLVNPKLLLEIKFPESEWSNLYRSMVIFENLNNVDYGWGLMELNKTNNLFDYI